MSRRPVRTSVLAALVPVALLGSGCSVKDNHADLVAGKQLFVKNCGSCHVLSRAGTKGIVGPNLDQAFQQDKKDGFGASAIRGVIKKQILYPNRSRDHGGIMPAKLVTGQAADDVASYVAAVVAEPGKDTGLLATAVAPAGSGAPIAAKGGTLSIPADPSGQLRYVSAKATASPGRLTVEMPNKSGVPHNIAINGKGNGKVVPSGTSSFSATFAAGTYTYFCQVPGHEQAGMKGTLTVK